MPTQPYLAAKDLLPVSRGRTLHIARTGSDGNPGTEAKPWKTIPWAMTHAQAGDLILAHPGAYPEPWPASCVSGTPDGTITITAANPADPPVIRTFPYLRAMGYWRINRFVLDGLNLNPGQSDAAFVLGASTAGGPAHHIEISQFEIRDCRKTGGHAHGFLRKEGAHHIDILAGTVRRIAKTPDSDKKFHQHGVYFGQGHHDRVIGNLFEDLYAGYGLHYWGDTTDSVAALNTVRRTYAAAATLGANTVAGPSRLLLELNAFEQTCLGKDGHHITNYNARGADVRIAGNWGDNTKPLIDTRLNGSSTRAGAGHTTTTMVMPFRDVVGHEVFQMPNLDPDPCLDLRQRVAELEAQRDRFCVRLEQLLTEARAA